MGGNRLRCILIYYTLLSMLNLIFITELYYKDHTESDEHRIYHLEGYIKEFYYRRKIIIKILKPTTIIVGSMFSVVVRVFKFNYILNIISCAKFFINHTQGCTKYFNNIFFFRKLFNGNL